MKWRKMPWLSAFLVLFWVTPLQSAEPVKRQTDSAENDLISALISRNQLELAARVCESHLNETQLDDDTVARWLIQAARVDTAMDAQQDASNNEAALAASDSDYQQRLASTERIEKFLAIHPDYPQRAWLQLQRLLNELSLITRQALTVLVSSGDQRLAGRERILARIVRAQSELKELTKEVEQQINEARSRTPASSEVQDLVMLVYLIAEKRLQTVLLQSDLFDVSSQDSIASATEAMSATKLMLDSLPAGSQTRSKFLQLHAEALRRLSRFDEAIAAINEALTIDPRSSDLVATAMRIEIAAGRLAQVRKWISKFQPSDRDTDLEFHLAMLEFTIAEAKQTSSSVDQQVLSQQIQRIRERFGAYAKRRAEQIALGVISPESSEISDPQLLIALAGQRLRDGQADDAVDSLMTAARATTNAKDAITLTIAAAAIERKRQAFSSAADYLREISLAHVDHADAPKLHYQASLLMRDHWPAPALIEQLQEFLITWPRDPLASDAVKWLDQLSVATEAYAASAQALTTVGLARSDEALLRTAYDRWTTAIARSGPAERQRLAEDAIKQLQSPANNIASSLSLQLALQCLPVTQVQPVAKPAFALLQQRDCFLWLAQARGLSILGNDPNATSTGKPDSFTTDERTLVIARLVEDAHPTIDSQLNRTDRRDTASIEAAKQSPLVQSRVGKALLELDRLKSLPLDTKIQAYDWTADYATSRLLIPADLQASDHLATSIASTLASSADAESRRVAMTLWNQIAARLTLGSTAWHQAKLAILDLLVASDQQAEASRLANYILLTQKPTDSTIVARYQMYLKQP